MTRNLTLIVILAMCTYACKKVDQTATTTSAVTKIAPDGFGFQTTKQVSVSVKLLAPDNTPIAGVPVSLYKNIVVNDNGNLDSKSAIFTGVSDASGFITGTITVPANLDTVLIDPNYTGIIRNAKVFISSGAITATLGGATGVGGNVVINQTRPSFNPQTNTSPLSRTNGVTTGTLGITYVSMGSADILGRPNYLTSPSDVISSTLISWLNTSLPESKPLTTTHPQYLTNSATGTLNITAAADVWITFVTEGASFLNSIGYYTYPTNNPPTTTSNIGTVNIILPNASLHASGGNMYAGDKVKLGTFSAGTSIGFVLFANAWTATNTINTSAQKFFSDTKLNPEIYDSVKRHSVLLNDATNNLFLVGFEDQLRTGASDNDFNDLVFYATSNPITAISTVDVAPIDKPTDTDGDGVTDVFDQYPTDATRAYNNYYPSQNSFSTLAFEDLWPSTGDYDMNDLVVGYRYNYVTNAKNQVVELYGDFAVQAAGASFQNGFGVQFPFTAASVKQVTGQKLISNYVKLASNGVEANQAKAVIIPFDNHQALISNPGGAYFINTKNEMSKVSGDTAHVYMQFVSPLTAAAFGTAPFNPFLISNMRRTYEIHLPDAAPTDLADTKLLGTGDDASNAANGIYYISKSNWPWALNFPSTFIYPLESVNISSGYLHFLDWAKSGGTLYTDWYTNTGVDFRNTTNLYTK